MATTFETVRDIIADRVHADRSRVTAETNPVTDLGADSLDLAEMIMDIEDAYSLRSLDMPDPLPSTVGGIVAAVDHILEVKAR